MQSEWSFNFARGPMTSAPRLNNGGYPIDLDGSLRYTRPATGIDFFPAVETYPNGRGIGCVQAFMPQQDAFVYAQMIARPPVGPSGNLNIPDLGAYVGDFNFPTLPQIGSDIEKVR